MDNITSYKEFNGEKIFCRYMKPKDGNDPKGLVYVSHGFGAHIGLYDELFELLSGEGYYVFGHDHYGHGKSSGNCLWVPTYDLYTVPCKLHIEEMTKQYPGKKMFIYGHSMGGTIAVRLLHQTENISDGLILEAPFLETPDSYPQWLISLGTFLGRIWPISLLRLGYTRLEDMTHDVELYKEYLQDPLRYNGPTTLAYATLSMDTLSEIDEKAKNIDVPLLIQHGDSDKICPKSGSERLFSLIGSADKTFKVYEEGFHMLRNETYRDIKKSVSKDLLEWINARC